MQHDPNSPSRQHVFRMFDRIAHRYDLLNRLLSFGRDVAWRKRLVRALPAGGALGALDLATGTADVLLALESTGRIARGMGADVSWGMLSHGQRKLRARGAEGRLALTRADAMCLPFPEGSFDLVTIAFGIRNVRDVDLGLREIHRVLRSGGRVLVLEFSLPPNRLFRGLYLFYFRHILPRLGGLISGDAHAYRYLNQTVETFPYGEDFLALLRQAGFTSAQAHPLTFGIATLYVADRG